MKCSNCGFTYDNEAVCPICGVPAYPAEQPMPYYAAPEPAVESPAFAEAPVRNTGDTPKAKKEPAPAKSGKGLKIAAFCVLAVIAAALVTGVVFQILSFSLERKYYSKATKALDESRDFLSGAAIDLEDFAQGESEQPTHAAEGLDQLLDGSDYQVPKVYNDSAVHKTGETFSFDSGEISLAGVKLYDFPLSDGNKQPAALTVTVKNTTDTKQMYMFPLLNMVDSAFDYDNYLFSQTDKKQDDDGNITLGAGETMTALFYYSLPKQSQTVDCTVLLYCMGEDGESNGSAGEYSASTAFSFETKDLK